MFSTPTNGNVVTVSPTACGYNGYKYSFPAASYAGVPLQVSPLLQGTEIQSGIYSQTPTVVTQLPLHPSYMAPPLVSAVMPTHQFVQPLGQAVHPQVTDILAPRLPPHMKDPSSQKTSLMPLLGLHIPDYYLDPKGKIVTTLAKDGQVDMFRFRLHFNLSTMYVNKIKVDFAALNKVCSVGVVSMSLSAGDTMMQELSLVGTKQQIMDGYLMIHSKIGNVYNMSNP